MASAQISTASSMADIKAFALSIDGFKADFDKRSKANWLEAIAKYEAVKAEVIEQVQVVAAEVEPAAIVVENAAVATHNALTSDKAISTYRIMLRAALTVGYLLILSLVTAGVWAWDKIDGEPAVVAWCKAIVALPEVKAWIAQARSFKERCADVARAKIDGALASLNSTFNHAE